MTTYYTFTKAGQTYHIIDKFTSDALINPMHVFVMTESMEDDTTHHCFIDCPDCLLRHICVEDVEDRLEASVKLYPEILENFPELGV